MTVTDDGDRSSPARHGRFRRRRHDVIARGLALARDLLGMDVTFVGRFEDDRETFPWTAGDAASFGLEESSLPLAQSYCQRVVRGTVPSLVRDTTAEPELARLPMTRDAEIGAYVGIPLRFSDGTVYGTLCAASHQANPELAQRDLAFMQVFAELVADHLERDRLESEKRRLAAEASGVAGLLAALEARDSYTGAHSDAVVKLVGLVARTLGLPESEVSDIEQVALLHDIGKVGVPDSILRKPAPLDVAEWALMREHPVIGARIISAIPSLAHLAPAIRAEHERWDGEGYPDGLRGEQIPLAARICLACDAFHAMVSDRPYRRAMERTDAVTELAHNAGRQFCPETVDALLGVLERVPADDVTAPARSLRPFALRRAVFEDDGELLAVEGELDMLTAAQLDAELGEALERSDWLVVDLSATSYFDSSALRVLANAGRAFERAGVGFALVRPDCSGSRAFELTDLHAVLDVYGTGSEAVNALRRE